MSNRFAQKGWGVLEFSMVAILLLSILLGGVSLSDFISTTRRLEECVDAQLYGTSVKPFVLGVQGDSAFGIRTNRAQIEDYLRKAGESVESAIMSEIAPGASYLVETEYIEVAIDPISGVVTRGADVNPKLVMSHGGLSPSRTASSETDLKKEFLRLISKAMDGQRDPGTSPSYLAIPIGTFSDDVSRTRFLETSILVGMRAVVDLDHTFGGSIYKAFMRKSETFSFKVISLRGDLDDGSTLQ